MLRQTKTVQFRVVIELLIAAWVMLGAEVAQKATIPKPQDNWPSERQRSGNCCCLLMPTITARSLSKSG
jgi:hypothetical protein